MKEEQNSNTKVSIFEVVHSLAHYGLQLHYHIETEGSIQQLGKLSTWCLKLQSTSYKGGLNE